MKWALISATAIHVKMMHHVLMDMEDLSVNGQVSYQVPHFSTRPYFHLHNKMLFVYRYST